MEHEIYQNKEFEIFNDVATHGLNQILTMMLNKKLIEEDEKKSLVHREEKCK